MATRDLGDRRHDRYGESVESILVPTVTDARHINGVFVGENPKFVLPKTNESDGLYCYPRSESG